jgi:sulfur carrier protein ThiS
MIKKIKIMEKHAAIDVNGKFVQRDEKKSTKDRKADSQQHTFSVF